MSRQITVKVYQRVFRRPLQTARGVWSIREGFLLCVEQDGQVGYGEVAPLPEFGSETVAEAGDFLRQLAREPQLEVPARLPCCAFGFSAALQEIECARDYTGVPTSAGSATQGVAERGARFDRLAGSVAQLESASRVRDNSGVEPSHAYAQRKYAVSALLPAGAAAGRHAIDKIAAGYRSLKWKIGVEPIGVEIALARSLIELLPAGVSVKFDANASLMTSELEQWLTLLGQFPEQVEYLEQPLPVGQEAAMADYMRDSGVPIALDESLNGAGGSRWLEPGAWTGPLVIKAALMGNVAELAAKLELVAPQVVLSSVFETGIGLENCLHLADALPQITRSIGFDTVNAFDDKLNHVRSAPQICVDARQNCKPDQIWNSI